ncbi:MAG: PLP-dependent aminotransferase family protein [Lachnospiraceae bacterium]|nr:PLP-dependent aminotransferase family protein [Lachnospiraceae bacterium]
MDLMIQLNTEQGSAHLYEQIYDYIKQEIKGGKLPRGEKLPSTRTLAQNLQISRTTVDLAYGQLVSEGYLESRPGSGYYVGNVRELYGFDELKKPSHGSRPVKEKYEVDFSTAAVDMEQFPFSTWRKINRSLLSQDNSSLFSLGDPQGDFSLRETIAGYLHSSRGAHILPEQLIVGAGNEYLLLLLEKILGNRRHIALESPTYQKAFLCFESCGFRISTISMDRQGMRVGELQQSGAQIAYVMPSHQYPTGIVMPIGRRQELLAWANQEPDRYIIEDDHDSEFRYKGKPVPCLQSIDSEEKVIYIGTFSKAIAPAIRISFLALPDPLLKIYQQQYRFFSSTVPRMDQSTLRQFMVEGHFERHLNRMRKCYRAKHDFLMQQLKPFRRQFVVGGENAGTFLTLTARDGRTQEELVKAAAERKIRVYPMDAREKDSHTVLIRYGGLSLEEIEKGIAALKEAFGILK